MARPEPNFPEPPGRVDPVLAVSSGLLAGGGTEPAPAPAAPYTYTLSAFNGDSPNGTWNLYIIDDANLDGGAVAGGWTITFDARPAPPAAGDILISEFRTRGEGTTPPGSDG